MVLPHPARGLQLIPGLGRVIRKHLPLGAGFPTAGVWELMSFTNYIDNIFCSGCGGAILSADILRGNTGATGKVVTVIFNKRRKKVATLCDPRHDAKRNVKLSVRWRAGCVTSF